VRSESVRLEKLQHWLLTAITQRVAPLRADVDQVLLPSLQQSALDRLAVYRSAYIARLLEILREQLPCTRFAVGDDLFDQFAASYLQAHPPHSYTLARLADKLVEHLNATRPAEWGELLVDLVSLEQTIDRVFDAPGPENLPPFTLPHQADESLSLLLAPGLELLAFRYPVSTYYTAWKAGQEPPWPQPQPQFVALLRRDYIVRRYELTRLQFELLLAISHGLPLGEAIVTATAGAANAETEKLAASFGDWFADWAAGGFFAAAS
jgi:hypothetical protein